jgi:hypothetical protein
LGFAAEAVLSKVGTLAEKGSAHRAGRAYSIVRSITDNVAALGEISVIMASGGARETAT